MPKASQQEALECEADPIGRPTPRLGSSFDRQIHTAYSSTTVGTESILPTQWIQAPVSVDDYLASSDRAGGPHDGRRPSRRRCWICWIHPARDSLQAPDFIARRGGRAVEGSGLGVRSAAGRNFSAIPITYAPCLPGWYPATVIPDESR
jgi:hypothetical protein